MCEGELKIRSILQVSVRMHRNAGLYKTSETRHWESSTKNASRRQKTKQKKGGKGKKENNEKKIKRKSDAYKEHLRIEKKGKGGS